MSRSIEGAIGKAGWTMEELTLYAIVEAIANFYGAFQALSSLMVPSSNVDDEILTALQGIGDQLTKVEDAITALQQAVELGLAEQELVAVDQTANQVGEYKGLAVTAAEEYAKWVQGGRTDSLMLDNALNNSLVAVNAFENTPTFWVLPFANQSEGVAENVFDWRIALVQYLYALTVRFTIISGTEPGWATDPTILSELTAHAQGLASVVAQMEAAIKPDQGSGVIPEESTSYYYWVRTSDTVSGLSTDPVQSGLYTSSQDADAQLSFMETYQFAAVRNKIGLTTVMLYQALLAWQAAGSPSVNTWTPWLAVAPSTGPDASIQLWPDFLFPFAACSSEPSGLSLFWVAPDGSINSSQMSPGANWTQPTVVMPASTAGATGTQNPLGATVVQAVSSQAGSTVLVWTTSDGSIQSSYYDTRATNPTWAKPFYVVKSPAPTPGWEVTPNGLLATVSTGPAEISVFWSSPAGAVMTSSFQLSVEQSGGGSEVVASAPTAEVQIVDDWHRDAGFAAASGGPGSVNAFWFSESGLMSSYFDKRAIIPGWATPFTIAAVATGDWTAVAAVGSAPYTVDVFWLSANSGEPQYTTILTSSYSIESKQEPLPDGMHIPVVGHTAPTSPIQVAPLGSVGEQILQIAAVTWVPLVPARWAFWMTESQAIQGAQGFPGSAEWTTPVTLGPPLGENYSPIVAVSPAASDIAVFMHAPDGTIVESRYHFAFDPIKL